MRIPRSALALALLGGLLCAGCQEAVPPAPVTEVRLVRVSALPTDPEDQAWQQAPVYTAPLIPQDLVDPRLMAPSTAQLQVRSLTDGSHVAFRLQWVDPSPDQETGPDRFADSCAVQLPARIEPTVPAPQMGEPGRPVHISFWNAAWEGPTAHDSLQDLYPRATIDHYPFQAASLEPGSADQQAMAERYAPARALGNWMAKPPGSAVQDLVAEGPGTLVPSPSAASTGRGQRVPDGWAVVIARPIPEGLAVQQPGQIAFAVWDGAHDEAGARKMRTGWITLVLQEKP